MGSPCLVGICAVSACTCLRKLPSGWRQRWDGYIGSHTRENLRTTLLRLHLKCWLYSIHLLLSTPNPWNGDILCIGLPGRRGTGCWTRSVTSVWQALQATNSGAEAAVSGVELESAFSHRGHCCLTQRLDAHWIGRAFHPSFTSYWRVCSLMLGQWNSTEQQQGARWAAWLSTAHGNEGSHGRPTGGTLGSRRRGGIGDRFRG